MATGQHSVRRVRRGEVGAAAATLARAFDDDPVMRWMFGDEQILRVGLPRMFGTMIRRFHLHHGATELVAGAGGPLGVATWDPPGRWRTPWWRTMWAVPSLLRAMPGRVAAAQAIVTAIETVHPSEPHWYLAYLGTDPSAQRQGIGGRLLRSRLAVCDAEAAPAYLESSNEANVPYYRSFGFEVTREIAVPDGGPTLWAMWRPPAAR
ncbi:GNAT family N-acetyltransferase [Actinocatenispora thailandica]|nr:GNAT family N-acetyltransferase [Actinocatenispora thailandica]